MAACLVGLNASAQRMGGGRPPMGGGRPPMGAPMGGMQTPFYEQESDSIAESKIQDVAGRLDLSEKQLDKMVKLYSQEFEEICRNLQMAVREHQMMQNGGYRGRNTMGMQPATTNVPFDSEAAKKVYDGIIKKFDKRYKKALNENQYSVWCGLTATTLDNKFNSILQHVRENTQSMF